MKGLGVSPGFAVAKALLKKTEKLEIERRAIENPDEEMQRLSAARDEARHQLELLQKEVETSIGAEEGKIFAAQKDMINDRTLFKEVQKRITDEKVNAEWALQGASQKFITLFEGMNNAYNRERAADIKDITRRIHKILLGVSDTELSNLSDDVVIIAEDILPSDTARMDKKRVKGFVTELGGRTSHSAIMARTLEIPAVVALEGIAKKAKDGDLVAINGETGEVFINPSEAELKDFHQKKNDYYEYREKLKAYKGRESVSRDGTKVILAANIGTPEDVDGAIFNDAEGVGLFRTEFLYMNRTQLPSEEEQFKAYRTVAEKMNGKPVVIRTLDIGGDKEIPYLGLSKEENPFLGFRAIRFCLERRDIFLTQLRAILRASAFGKIEIMFPMISGLTELRRAKEILSEAKESLANEGTAFDQSVEAGIMIEIPSAAFISDILASEADFFSIGTNDLTQYMIAVDRGNQKVAHLYNSLHPALLRLIKLVIDNAHNKGKWVGMCGEAAGDPRLIPLLLGMGLDEFSMSASSVLNARSIILGCYMEEMARHVGKVLSLSTPEEVEAYIKTNILRQE